MIYSTQSDISLLFMLINRNSLDIDHLTNLIHTEKPAPDHSAQILELQTNKVNFTQFLE